MHFFARAVVYGFAFSLGAALFKKIQNRIGLGEDKDKKSEPDAVRDPSTDPKLQS